MSVWINNKLSETEDRICHHKGPTLVKYKFENINTASQVKILFEDETNETIVRTYAYFMHAGNRLESLLFLCSFSTVS